MADFYDLKERDFVGAGAGSASRWLSKSEAAKAEGMKEWVQKEIKATAQLNPMFPYLRQAFDPVFWFGGKG